MGVLEEETEGGGGRRGRWIREAAGGGRVKELEREPTICDAPGPVAAAPPPVPAPAAGRQGAGGIMSESGEGDK